MWMYACVQAHACKYMYENVYLYIFMGVCVCVCVCLCARAHVCEGVCV